jgi:spore coat polysaccharide biosynthesis protein SpsF (cytidylyltransferase family)
MLDLAGKTLVERVYETVSKSTRLNKIVVATSIEKSDDIINIKLTNLGIECFRGDLNNVLKRFFDASQKYKAKNIIRITADNPLMDAKLIDDLILHYEKSGSEYSMFSNAIYGLSAEIFSYHVLSKAYKNARNDLDREHVTPYIKDTCKTSIIDMTKKYKKPELSATVDTLDDYIKMQKFYLLCQENNIQANIDNFLKSNTDEN